jgi:GNAT superfamily N-acetyltransferase
MTVEIEVAAQPSDADREAIFERLVSYNETVGGPSRYEPLAIRLRDKATGRVNGGLWGQLFYNWLYVELLFVPEEERGKNIGSRLIAEAEAIAREKSCVGVWLDTFAFQAPEFYRKLGYEVFGTLNDYPTGGKRVFFRKLLDRVG